MKRWKHNILAYSEAEIVNFDTKISEDKTKFEDTTIYKELSKNLENAQKAYEQSLLDDKMDEVVYLELLNVAEKAFNDLLATQVKVNYEDSFIECPQIGQRVIFLENYSEVDLLDKDVLKLSQPFFVDTGEEYIVITKDNYKDYLGQEILTETTDKYEVSD